MQTSSNRSSWGSLAKHRDAAYDSCGSGGRSIWLRSESLAVAEGTVSFHFLINLLAAFNFAYRFHHLLTASLSFFSFSFP